MFCKNCGNQIADDSKFCNGCGAKTDSKKPEQNQSSQQQTYTAPKPFQEFSTIDPNQPIYQKSAFKGKQVSAGSSGEIKFGGAGGKKGGCLKKILLGALILVILVVTVTLLSNGNGLTNLQMASEVNGQTNIPINATTVFNPNSPVFNCTFAANVEPETKITVEWWYITDDVVITTFDYNVFHKGEQVNFSLSKPNGGWPVGDYEAKLYVNGEFETSAKFKVE